MNYNRDFEQKSFSKECSDCSENLTQHKTSDLRKYTNSSVIFCLDLSDCQVTEYHPYAFLITFIFELYPKCNQAMPYNKITKWKYKIGNVICHLQELLLPHCLGWGKGAFFVFHEAHQLNLLHSIATTHPIQSNQPTSNE